MTFVIAAVPVTALLRVWAHLESEAGYCPCYRSWLIHPRGPKSRAGLPARKSCCNAARPEDALEEYLQILLEDPENDNVRQLSADLCLSLNRNGQAVSACWASCSNGRCKAATQRGPA